MRRDSAVDVIEQQLEATRCQLGTRLGDGGEADAQVSAELDAVKPGHRHVRGHPQAGRLERVDQPDRHHVVGGRESR